MVRNAWWRIGAMVNYSLPAKSANFAVNGLGITIETAIVQHVPPKRSVDTIRLGAYTRERVVRAWRRGLSRLRRRLPEGSPIPKNIEVAHDGGSKYFIPVIDAKRLVATGQANWAGPKSITLKASTSKRGLWAVRGPAAMYSDGLALGPKFGTLQLT